MRILGYHKFSKKNTTTTNLRASNPLIFKHPDLWEQNDFIKVEKDPANNERTTIFDSKIPSAPFYLFCRPSNKIFLKVLFVFNSTYINLNGLLIVFCHL